MEKQFGIITAEHAWIRGAAEGEDGRNSSGIEDEIFSGWAVRILDEEKTKQYVKVETHYGYTGYVNRRELKNVTRKELVQYQNTERFLRIGISEADLLDQPKVQGLPLELLLKNSIVELMDRDVTEGWSRVRSASGKIGYIHTENLKKRRDSDEYLFQEETEKTNCFQNWKNLYGEEEVLRKKLTDSARDAQILTEYPVKEISREQLKKGDLLFFPGHVAMYLGAEKYIHATGYVKTPYVTINSLQETDQDYRPDLAEKITGYGSIFA